MEGDKSITVGELIEMLNKYPKNLPVYISSDGEKEVQEVTESLAFGMFECVEIK